MLAMLASPSTTAPMLPSFPSFPAMRAVPPAMQVQGGSLRTWRHGSRPGQSGEVGVELDSDGRPLDANIEIWQGPGNTPVTSRVYGDNGYMRPVRASFGTGSQGWGTNAVAVRNTGPLEFPIDAAVGAGERGVGGAFQPRSRGIHIQGGGALRTFTFDGSVGSVQVNLWSEGMPINGLIEVLQGPNSNRQGIDLYSDNGRGKPISYLLETPGYGTTISITNTGPIEYPMTASVVPYGPQRPGNDMCDGGAYGSSMALDAPPHMGTRGRYGGVRRVSEAQRLMATGRKWFERGQMNPGSAPRGPPPRYGDPTPGMQGDPGMQGHPGMRGDLGMHGGPGDPSAQQAPPQYEMGASHGARYGASSY